MDIPDSLRYRGRGLSPGVDCFRSASMIFLSNRTGWRCCWDRGSCPTARILWLTRPVWSRFRRDLANSARRSRRTASGDAAPQSLRSKLLPGTGGACGNPGMIDDDRIQNVVIVGGGNRGRSGRVGARQRMGQKDPYPGHFAANRLGGELSRPCRHWACFTSVCACARMFWSARSVPVSVWGARGGIGVENGNDHFQPFAEK